MVNYRKTIVIYVAAVLVALLFISPVAWLVSASFQKESALLSIPSHFIPKEINFDSYLKLMASDYYESSKSEDAGVRSYSVPNQAKLYPGALLNSFIISVSTTIICLLIGSLTAYTITRLDFKGRNVMFFGILGSRMVPSLSLVIPFFILSNKLGMTDKKIWLILVYTSFTLPYIIWMLRGFFESIPKDLEEAARIDGCTRIGTIFRIIYPMIIPGLIAAGIFAFMQTWNEFFYALIMTNSEKAFTVPVVSGMFASELDIDYSLMITSGVLTMAPPIIFTFIFQRYIMSGLTAGGVKG